MRITYAVACAWLGLLPALLGGASRAGAGDAGAAPAAQPGCRIVVPSLDFGGNVEAVRFHPISGRTWFVSRSVEPHLEEVKEPAPLATGPYDVTAAALGGSVLLVMRLDERSGRTWLARGNGSAGRDEASVDGPEPGTAADPALGAWTPIPETTTSPVAAPGPSDPGPAAYLLRMEGTESGADALRLRRDTGQAWALGDRAWEPIVDAVPPGAGTYEGFLAPMGKAGRLRFRFDERSGRLWFERARAWTLVGTDPRAGGGDAAGGGSPGPYRCLRSPLPGATFFVRTHPATGRLWLLGRGWMPVPEPKPPPPGAYEFRLVDGVVAGAPVPIRFDPRTGRTWLSPDGESWEDIDDGSEGGMGEPPSEAPRFDVVVSAPSRIPYTTRFDRRTGATWVPKGDGTRVRVAEPAPLASGEYAISCVTSGLGKSLLLRLDRVGGRWWILAEGAWSPIAGPAAVAVGAGSPARFVAQVLPTAEHAVGTWCDTSTGQVLGWSPTNDRAADRPAEGSRELAALPPGDYAIETVVFGGVGRGQLPGRVRFERGTGRLWIETLDGSSLDRLASTWKEVR